MKHTILAIALLTMVALALVGCAGTPTGDAIAQEKIKIGIATTVSGDLAFMGENIVRSAELTMDYYGLGDRYELVIEDIPCGSGASSVSSFQKLIDVDGVQFIAGALCSGDTLAAAPLLNERHVVLMPSSTGGENIDLAGEYIFRNGPSDIKAGTAPAHEMNELGVQKVALITDQSDYTLDIAKHFKRVYAGEVVYDTVVPVGTRDFRTIIAQVQASGAEAILITTQDGITGANIIKQLYELDNTATVYGNFLVYGPHLRSIAGNAAEGINIYDPEFDEGSEGVRDFFTAYEKKYNMRPTIPFQTTGVRDAILMFVEAEQAIREDGGTAQRTVTGEAVHDWLLENVQDWPGFNGNVTFDENGNSGTGFVLKHVKDGELVLV